MKKTLIEMIRLRLTVSLVFIIALSIYIFTSGSTYETNSIKQTQNVFTGPGGGNNFIYGAFNSGYDFNYIYSSLGFNIWCVYNC